MLRISLRGILDFPIILMFQELQLADNGSGCVGGTGV